MYLHLGGETLVRTADILGIFDLDNASASHITREFLRRAQKEGRLSAVSDELPKSLVACADGQVYLSQLNSATLLRRAENITYE